jgi:transposase-like protein
MPKSHRPYLPEFRQRIVELVRKGRTPEELVRQFEPSAQAIRNWVRQADRDDGRRQDGLTTAWATACRPGSPAGSGTTSGEPRCATWSTRACRSASP